MAEPGKFKKMPKKSKEDYKKDLKGIESKLGRLEKKEANTENTAEIERLRGEADKLVTLMDRLEETELAKMETANPDEAAKTKAELALVIDEAAEIQKQLAALDAEEATLDIEIPETKEQIRKERLSAITDELKAQWNSSKPKERLLSAQEKADMGNKFSTVLTEEYSEFLFDHKGKGKNSIGARAEKILLERFPEYKEVKQPPTPAPEPLPEPTPASVGDSSAAKPEPEPAPVDEPDPAKTKKQRKPRQPKTPDAVPQIDVERVRSKLEAALPHNYAWAKEYIFDQVGENVVVRVRLPHGSLVDVVTINPRTTEEILHGSGVYLGEVVERANENLERINETYTYEDTEEEEDVESGSPDAWAKQKVEDFIVKFGLEKLVPPEFNNLKELQQLKTVQDLKQRITDMVKQDARTQYSESAKEQLAVAAGHPAYQLVQGLLNKVKVLLTKESDVKNNESKVFSKLKDTEEGKQLLADNMVLLTEMNGKQEIKMGYDGKLLIDYAKDLKLGANKEDQDAVGYYNYAANEFRTLPYEWGLEKEGSKKWKAYHSAKNIYDSASFGVMDLKRHAPGGDEQAKRDMLELKNSLMLEQLLNTHPELDKEFSKLSDEAGGQEVWETIKRMAGLQSTEAAGLTTVGAGLRWGTKAAAVLVGGTTATVGLLVTAPVFGAIIGHYRARMRAKTELRDKEKEARYGGENAGPGSKDIVSVDKTLKRLDMLVTKIVKLENEGGKEKEVWETTRTLKQRVEYIEGKIEKGLVNFGDQKQSLNNQFALMESLHKAIALLGMEEIYGKDLEISEKEKKWEERFRDSHGYGRSFRDAVAGKVYMRQLTKDIRIEEEQEAYINKQAKVGAWIGGSAATAGYLVRWLYQGDDFMVEFSQERKEMISVYKKLIGHYEHQYIEYQQKGDSVALARVESLLIGAKNGLARTESMTDSEYEKFMHPDENDTGSPDQTTRTGAQAQPDTAKSTHTPPESETRDIISEVAPDKATAAREYFEQAVEHYERAKDYYNTAIGEDKKIALDNMNQAKAELDFQAKYLEDATGKEIPDEEATTVENTAPEEEQSAPTSKGQTAPAEEEHPATPTEEEPSTPAKKAVPEKEAPTKPVKPEKPGTGKVKVETTPSETVSEIKDLPPGLDAKAVVGRGKGITFAFKNQIDADPTLAEALKKQIGYEGATNDQEFYKALGKKFGYIKANGEWLGVKKGGVAAYQFEKNGDEYVVTEYHKVGGAWKEGESHDMSEEFEGEDHEKEYEYLDKPKRAVEDGGNAKIKTPGVEENPQFARPEEQVDKSTNSEQFARPVKPDSEDLDNGQLARAPKGTGDANPPATKSEDDMRIRTRTVPQTEKVVPPAGKSETTILESDKEDVRVGVVAGPDGRPVIVEDFKLVGGKALRLFADRYGYENLSTSQVDFVGQRYRFNLNKIFEKSSDWTNKLSKMSAPKLLRMNVGDTVTGNTEELSVYIKMLNKATGMKPFDNGFVGNKETAKDYTLRMLFELEKRGKLDAFNDKFDAFMGEDKAKIEIPVEETTAVIPEAAPEAAPIAAEVEFDPNKANMYDLWEKYNKQPESLSEEEYAFAEKAEGLRKKLGSDLPGMKADESADSYMNRLEKAVSKQEQAPAAPATPEALTHYPTLKESTEYNMTDGMTTMEVLVEKEGKRVAAATAFYFDSAKINAHFISNDQHPECFSEGGGKIVDYSKVEDLLKKQGKDTVMGFAGAYRAPDGNIEGVAYEGGVSVGQVEYSKWHGFVYISKDGKIELFRAKNADDTFDKVLADKLVNEAKNKGGSLYQQIPAIWEGKLRLDSTRTDLYEMRAICESRDGKQFIIDAPRKMTQAEFLKMCLDMKDANGKPAVYNLMLTDTGECSLATFREQDGTDHNLIDNQFTQQGYTNVVVLSKRK